MNSQLRRALDIKREGINQLITHLHEQVTSASIAASLAFSHSDVKLHIYVCQHPLLLLSQGPLIL